VRDVRYIEQLPDPIGEEDEDTTAYCGDCTYEDETESDNVGRVLVLLGEHDRQLIGETGEDCKDARDREEKLEDTIIPGRVQSCDDGDEHDPQCLCYDTPGD